MDIPTTSKYIFKIFWQNVYYDLQPKAFDSRYENIVWHTTEDYPGYKTPTIEVDVMFQIVSINECEFRYLDRGAVIPSMLLYIFSEFGRGVYGLCSSSNNELDGRTIEMGSVWLGKSSNKQHPNQST